jgi:hypothetical protein
LGIVIDVGSGAEVSVVREGPELGGDEGAGHGASVHFPEHHACRFQKAERCVDR